MWNNELSGKLKTEKYKLPLQWQLRFHAFHPKAVNDIVQVAGLLA